MGVNDLIDLMVSMLSIVSIVSIFSMDSIDSMDSFRTPSIIFDIGTPDDNDPKTIYDLIAPKHCSHCSASKND